MTDTGYQVVHAIPGRIRLRISWLETDADAAGKLQCLLESFNFVSGVRVNPTAQSIVITYKTSALSSQEAVERFVTAMQQIKPTPLDTSPPSAQVDGEAVVQMAQTVVQTVAQTMQTVAQTVQTVVQTANTTAQESTQESASDPPQTGTRPEATNQTPIETNTPSSPPTNTPQQTSQPSATVIPEIPCPWGEANGRKPSATQQPPTPTPTEPKPDPASADHAPQQPELWLHSTASLAKRLKVTSQAITRHRTQSDFSTWTQRQDPEGIAWCYDASSQSFYPFTTLASSLEEPGETAPSPDKSRL